MRYLFFIFFLIISCKNPLISNEALKNCFENCDNLLPTRMMATVNGIMNVDRNQSVSETVIIENLGTKEINYCSYIVKNSTIPSIDYTLNVHPTTCQITFQSSNIGNIELQIIGNISNNETISDNIQIEVIDRVPNIIAFPSTIDLIMGNSVVGYEIISSINITGCSISPSLPTGLYLTHIGNKCVFGGNPSSINSKQNYIVSLHNNTTSTQTTIEIGVYTNICSDLAYNTPVNPTFFSSLNKYVICTPEQLKNINPTNSYILGNHIDVFLLGLTDVILMDFYGDFDGNGYTISGLNYPLFGNIWGTVKNISFDNNYLTPSSDSGVIAKNLKNSAIIDNIEIKNTFIDDSVHASSNNSAISGNNDSGSKISNILIKSISAFNGISCIQGSSQGATLLNTYILNALSICFNHSSIVLMNLFSFPYLNDYWKNAGTDSVFLEPKIIKLYQ